MNRIILIMSFAALLATVTGCKDSAVSTRATCNPERQERDFIRDAIRHRSPDVQRVDIIDSTVVYTHICDGIVDVKTYAFVGDVCVGAERVFTFPNQMSALRHYRDAVEKAELYENIELMREKVKYTLKDAQHELESKGLTKEQLKAKFDRQIEEAKADIKR